MKRKKELILDKKDRELLYYLDVNGRLTYSQLAKRTRMSKQLVKYRISRLEHEGYIKGYFTMIDTSRLGFTTFRVYLKFRNLTPEKKTKIINYLKNREAIWAVVLLAGKWDVGLGISVRDIYDFYNVWEKLLKEHLDLIGDFKVCIYSPIYHYARSYLIDREDTSAIRILGGREKAEFDERDMLILTALSKNARISLLDIADNVKLTPEAVSARIKQLEKKGIIQGYRGMIDVHKIGLEFYKAEIRLSNYNQIDDILRFCHKHKNIYQVDKTIGGETLEIEFHVGSLNKMLEIINEFEKTFPKTIERFDYITVLTEEKVTYAPDLNYFNLKSADF